MSKETIKIIREAEETAKQIKIQADNNAKQMIADERKKGEEFLANAEKSALEEANRQKVSAGNEGKKIIADAETEAHETAKSIEETAKSRLNDAINMIIREACS